MIRRGFWGTLFSIINHLPIRITTSRIKKIPSMYDCSMLGLVIIKGCCGSQIRKILNPVKMSKLSTLCSSGDPRIQAKP